MINQQVKYLKNEVWKDVVGYEGRYRVSSFGRVKNKYCRILSPFFDKDGYARFRLYTGNGERPHFSAHRLVMLCFVGPSTLVVNHIDGDKKNNYLGNLEYCTQLENDQHASRLGLKPKGTSHGMSKINNDIAYLIHLFSSFMVYREIGDYFGIDRRTVKDVLDGRTWSHIWES